MPAPATVPTPFSSSLWPPRPRLVCHAKLSRLWLSQPLQQAGRSRRLLSAPPDFSAIWLIPGIYGLISECNLHLGAPPPRSPLSLSQPPILSLSLPLPLLLHLVPGDSREKGRHYPGRRRGLGAHGRRGGNKGADAGQGGLCPIGRVLKRGNGRGNGHWSRCGSSTAAYADGSTGEIEANYIVNGVSLCYTKGYKRYTYNPQRQLQPLSAEPIGRLFCYMYVSNCK